MKTKITTPEARLVELSKRMEASTAAADQLDAEFRRLLVARGHTLETEAARQTRIRHVALQHAQIQVELIEMEAEGVTLKLGTLVPPVDASTLEQAKREAEAAMSRYEALRDQDRGVTQQRQQLGQQLHQLGKRGAEAAAAVRYRTGQAQAPAAQPLLPRRVV